MSLFCRYLKTLTSSKLHFLLLILAPEVFDGREKPERSHYAISFHSRTPKPPV